MIDVSTVFTDASIVSSNASIDNMLERPNGDCNSRELKNYERRYHDFRSGKKKEEYQIRHM